MSVHVLNIKDVREYLDLFRFKLQLWLHKSWEYHYTCVMITPLETSISWYRYLNEKNLDVIYIYIYVIYWYVRLFQNSASTCSTALDIKTFYFWQPLISMIYDRKTHEISIYVKRVRKLVLAICLNNLVFNWLMPCSE